MGEPKNPTTKQPKKRGPKPKPKPPATDIIKKPKRTDVPSHVELPEGDNNKYTTFALDIMKLPKINLQDPQVLQQRLFEYFQLCADRDMKPAVASMALALGLDRRRLWEINNDVPGRNTTISEESKTLIKMAYNSLDVLFESYFMNGKINPVTAIFIGKNNFGYQDKQEYVLTPNQQLSSVDPTTIEQKYAELPDLDGEQP